MEHCTVALLALPVVFQRGPVGSIRSGQIVVDDVDVCTGVQTFVVRGLFEDRVVYGKSRSLAEITWSRDPGLLLSAASTAVSLPPQRPAKV
jgi:hypothetical protein